MNKNQIYTNHSQCLQNASKRYQDCLLGNLFDGELYHRCPRTFEIRKQQCKVQYYNDKAEYYK